MRPKLKSGKNVTSTDVEAARAPGATDLEIHDTDFDCCGICMFNRYAPMAWIRGSRATKLFYRERARKTAREGYVSMSNKYLPQPAAT